jgi:drug/metabolite transporter (DMT)-like permease
MAARCIVSLPILLALVHFDVGLHRVLDARWKPLLLRGLILLVSYTSYYLALPALPLAEAVALFFVAPIIVTILSIPLLGEKVSLASWGAILLGFAGVMVILQPGTALFKPAALYSLTSAGSYALAMVLARRIGVTESATVMALYQNVVYLAGALAAASGFWLLGLQGSEDPSLNFLTRPWVWPETRAFLLMAACGVIAAIAMSLLTQAYRIGNANLVTAFEYTGMIWAPLWGLLFFGERPQTTTVIGLGMIFAAGLMSAVVAAVRTSPRGRLPSTG